MQKETSSCSYIIFKGLFLLFSQPQIVLSPGKIEIVFFAQDPIIIGIAAQDNDVIVWKRLKWDIIVQDDIRFIASLLQFFDEGGILRVDSMMGISQNGQGFLLCRRFVSSRSRGETQADQYAGCNA